MAERGFLLAPATTIRDKSSRFSLFPDQRSWPVHHVSFALNGSFQGQRSVPLEAETRDTTLFLGRSWPVHRISFPPNGSFCRQQIVPFEIQRPARIRFPLTNLTSPIASLFLPTDYSARDGACNLRQGHSTASLLPPLTDHSKGRRDVLRNTDSR